MGRGAEKRPGGEKGEGAKTVAVERLPEHLQKLVRRGLEEGWTVEGVAEAVANESAEYRVTAAGVENYFWSNPQLLAARVAWKKQRVEELKGAIEKPGSAEALLLDAVLMGGLTDLYQHTRRIRPKDAATASLQRETLEARQELLKLKARRARREEELMVARVEHIARRNELLKEQISQLRRWATADRTRVEPEVMRQIEQIYGLAALPEIPEEKDGEA